MCDECQLLAGMDVNGLHASLAIDEAAPVELAVASLFDCDLLRVVSSTAAHEVAAVRAVRGAVADPALSPWNILNC